MAGTVTVACKLPHGLVLRLMNKTTVPEGQRDGGTKNVPKWVPRPQSPTITLKGYLDKYQPGLPPAARGSSYALTPGIDKDFFDEWLKQNHDLDAVVNGLVFADEKLDAVEAMTREMADVRSGLEPIDPSKLPRGIQAGTTAAA